VDDPEVRIVPLRENPRTGIRSVAGTFGSWQEAHAEAVRRAFLEPWYHWLYRPARPGEGGGGGAG
jgi:hypothetical protein